MGLVGSAVRSRDSRYNAVMRRCLAVSSRRCLVTLLAVLAPVACGDDGGSDDDGDDDDSSDEGSDDDSSSDEVDDLDALLAALPAHELLPPLPGTCSAQAWQDGKRVAASVVCDDEGGYELGLAAGVSGTVHIELLVTGHLRGPIPFEVPEQAPTEEAAGEERAPGHAGHSATGPGRRERRPRRPPDTGSLAGSRYC